MTSFGFSYSGFFPSIFLSQQICRANEHTIFSQQIWHKKSVEQTHDSTSSAAHKITLPGIFNFTLFVWIITHHPTLLFSQNKSAPTNQPIVFFPKQINTSHQPGEQVARF
jgi:hypothetical protein